MSHENLTVNLSATSAQYVNAVNAILENGSFSIFPYLTTTCPECDTVPSAEAIADHVFDASGRYILVGCEGYHVVNPNVVGVPSPNWQGSEDAVRRQWGAGAEHYLAGPCQDPDCEIHHDGEADHADRTCKVCHP